MTKSGTELETVFGKEIGNDLGGKDLSIAIVASRFNRFIVDQLVEGAADALKRHGIDDHRLLLGWVPGAIELPLLAD